jgi:hypothetical protein
MAIRIRLTPEGDVRLWRSTPSGLVTLRLSGEELEILLRTRDPRRAYPSGEPLDWELLDLIVRPLRPAG